MKLLIASDIHGAAGYCRQLLDAWDREGADRLLLLGKPLLCLLLLTRSIVHGIMGNIPLPFSLIIPEKTVFLKSIHVHNPI